MKKYFICTDIHSHYNEWMTALKKADFDIENNDHIIIHCGDLLDRGNQPLECLKFICDMIDKNRAICIKGNHEVLLERIVKHKEFQIFDQKNGTILTFDLLAGDKDKYENDSQLIEAVWNNLLIQKYYANLKWYYETDKYIFCHAWVPDHKDWRKGFWMNSIWDDPFEMWNARMTIKGKTIICGHVHTFSANSKYHNSGCKSLDEMYEKMNQKQLQNYLEKVQRKDGSHLKIAKKYLDFSPFKDEGIWALDAATIFSKQVNIITRSQGMKKQSDLTAPHN